MRQIALCMILIISVNAIAQTQISGFIKDKSSGEALINANIYTNTYKQSSTSDNYGYFSIPIDKNADSLYFSYVGYQRVAIKVKNLNEKSNLNIMLMECPALDEVSISAESISEEIRSHQLGANRLSMKNIENMPSILGEPDILKVLQNMPGVQNGTSGTAGLFVRGTGPGQSLILLDGVPVYNVNHLYGFYSVFNSDAINSATLYKGGFPARYGGRSSAVLDISMREGRNDKISAKGTIGVAASRLLLEGPIIKDKLNFLVSARRTYADLFIKAITNLSSPDPENRMDFGYYFYDATAKLNYKISNKSRLMISFYGGKDNLNIDNQGNTEFERNSFVNNIKWGNKTGSIRYNFADNAGGFSNAQFYVSNYKFNELSKSNYYSKEISQFTSIKEDNFLSEITDFGGCYSYDKSFGNLSLRSGIGVVQHNFIPSEGSMTRFFNVSSDPTFIDTSYSQGNKQQTEAYYYIENTIKLAEKWTASAGIRIVNHNLKRTAFELEPRVQLQYLFNNNLSFKTSYARVSQNSFLITTNSLMSPADLWVFKTDDMAPIISNQYDIGICSSLWNEIKISIETYYKQLNNLLGYREGGKFDKLNDWSTNIVQGRGETYGFETLLERKFGKISGWFSYTLAYSNRQFDEQNAGKPYRYKYDNRHSISIVSKYQFNKQFSINAQWNYSSGSLISLYTHNGYSAYKYDEGYFFASTNYASSKNNHQMPAYHQLDIGFTYTKQKKHALIKWNYGIYNIYNHVNPFYITQSNGETKLHGIIPFLPYVSYSFAF